MKRIPIFIAAAFGFSLGILFVLFWIVYVNRPTGPAFTITKTLKFTGHATNITESIPLYCSGAEPCEATLNNGKKLPLRIYGQFDKVLIALGDQTMESWAFYENVYQGKYPEGVASIDFKFKD